MSDETNTPEAPASAAPAVQPETPSRAPGRAESGDLIELAKLNADLRSRLEAAEKARAKAEKAAAEADQRISSMRSGYARQTAVAKLAPSMAVGEVAARALVSQFWGEVEGLERAENEDDDGYTARQIDALGEALRAKAPEIFRPAKPDTTNAGNLGAGPAAPPMPRDPYRVPIQKRN